MIARLYTALSALSAQALIGAVLLSVAEPATGSGARAQDAPVVFTHGFRSGGASWAPTANALSARLQIKTLSPTTSWGDDFGVQSQQLRDALNTWSNAGVIGIAHSNGGLTARAYAQAQGSNSRLDRLVTIGTPHSGAPFARNVLNGYVVGYFGSLAANVAGAVNFYANNDPDWSYGPVIDFITRDALGFVTQVGQILQDNSAFIGLGFGQYLPVIKHDVPGSPFLANLNGNGMVSEASALSYRIGISTQVDPYGAMFALLTSDPDRATRVRNFAASAALELYFYYRDHPDPYLAGNARRWLNAYYSIALMDVVWHDLIGALKGFGGPYGYGVAYIYASDGFIPEPNSQYPGANGQRQLYLPNYNIAHTRQMDDPGARSEYENILTSVFSIPYRPSNAPPPPPPDACTDPTQLICSPPLYAP